MRHPIRLWFPVLVLCVLAVVCSRASGASFRASSDASAKPMALTAGLEHTCALTLSGGVKCWGYNGHDELGVGRGGDPPWSPVPLDVAGLTSGVTMVSAGLRHSCAVVSAGRAMCWGVSYGGALGDGTEDRHFAPVDVVGLSGGVTAVSAGYDRACALLRSGGVQCWGTGYGYAPIDIPGLSSARALSAGNVVGCVITTT